MTRGDEEVALYSAHIKSEHTPSNRNEGLILKAMTAIQIDQVSSAGSLLCVRVAALE